MDTASTSPAEVYDSQFVPALFAPWASVVADAAEVAAGHRVLDVGCGTGALARAVAARVGDAGSVIGLDVNDEMLAVARRKLPDIGWRSGRAEALPFDDASFDRVVSQFALMFFDDRVAGLREMLRVLRPGGTLAIAVCDALDHSLGYAVLAELLERLFGHDVADAFRAPFALGNADELRALCAAAGLPRATVERRDGTVRFASIAALVATERACAWTLGGLLDANQFARLQVAAEESLRPFVTSDGSVEFGMPALLIRAATR